MHAQGHGQRRAVLDEGMSGPWRVVSNRLPWSVDGNPQAAFLDCGLAGRVVNSVNVPCVPRRSGVDIALSCAPWKRSGGNVIGTRRIVLQMPCSPSTDQNGLDFPQQPELRFPERNPEAAEPKMPIRAPDVS